MKGFNKFSQSKGFARVFSSTMFKSINSSVLSFLHSPTLTSIHPEPSSLLPPHSVPLGRPSAPAPSMQYRASNLDWQLISCFFDDPADFGNLISGSSAFCKTSLNIWKFTVHVFLKPGLENSEYYFTSVRDECNCAVV